jgi:hypothetical protein
MEITIDSLSDIETYLIKNHPIPDDTSEFDNIHMKYCQNNSPEEIASLRRLFYGKLLVEALRKFFLVHQVTVSDFEDVLKNNPTPLTTY